MASDAVTSPAPEHPFAALVRRFEPDMIRVRREIHADPELSRDEVRTTALIAAHLRAAGLDPVLMPHTGLWVDIGPEPQAGRVALRADLDALPVPDETGQPWASRNPGVTHACGHDVHSAAVLGAGLVLAEAAKEGWLPAGVRLLFQPAEEIMPGGALDIVRCGGLTGVRAVLGLHCDPTTDVGKIGLKVGALTAAADHIRVTLHGRGGHTSRPHLAGDLIFTIGRVITGVPAALSRRLDPRAGATLVWGHVNAGQAANAIPNTGTLAGTLRCLDVNAWEEVYGLLTEVVHDTVRPFGLTAEVEHTRGVPPVVNDPQCIQWLDRAARAHLGAENVLPTQQSLGGEDFAWYLVDTPGGGIPGAMMRLGTRIPGGPTYDLHRQDFDADERAIGIGAAILAQAAYVASED